jgi:small GTP-binding protein
MSFSFLGGRVFKSVLIGDGAVGKTSIRRNYLGDQFMEGHLPTIGVDLAQKSIRHEGKKVKWIIWDLAGQPSFESVRKHYYQGAHGILLVYSVIDRRSFDNALKWLTEAYKYMGKLPPTVVLGNKIDLRSQVSPDKLVSKEEGQSFANLVSERLDVSTVFRETSALTGENIDDAFHQILRLMSEEEERRSQDFVSSRE